MTTPEEDSTMAETNGRNGWTAGPLRWLASAQLPVDGILSEGCGGHKRTRRAYLERTPKPRTLAT